MSQYSDRDRVLALAGLFQGAALANQLAWKGQADSQAFQASLDSVFADNPDSVEDVFGGADGVRLGLRILVETLEQGPQKDAHVTRYAANLMALARKLKNDAKLSSQLANDLTKVKDRTLAFSFDNTGKANQLAAVYQQHISPQSPRILVKGDPAFLNTDAVAARIRTALLAGIRAAHLWMQCGGNRWQLLWNRRKVLGTAQSLLK